MKSSNLSERDHRGLVAAIEQLEDRQLLSTAPLASGVPVMGGSNHPAVRAVATVHNVDIVGTFTGPLHLNHTVPALGAVHKVSATITVSTQSSTGQVSGSVALDQLGTFPFTGSVHRHAVALTLDAGSGASGTLTGSAAASGKSLQLRLNSLVNAQRVDGTLHASMGSTKPAGTSASHHGTHVGTTPTTGTGSSTGMTGTGHSTGTTGTGTSTGTSGTTNSGSGQGGSVVNGGSGTFSGPGSATSGPGTATGGPGTATGGPGTATSGPGSPTSGPGTATGGPGTATSGPGTATGGPGTATGGPGTVNGGVTPMGPMISFVQPSVNPAGFFGISFVQPTVIPGIGSVGAVQLTPISVVVGTEMIDTTMPVDGAVFGSTPIM